MIKTLISPEEFILYFNLKVADYDSFKTNYCHQEKLGDDIKVDAWMNGYLDEFEMDALEKLDEIIIGPNITPKEITVGFKVKFIEARLKIYDILSVLSLSDCRYSTRDLCGFDLFLLSSPKHAHYFKMESGGKYTVKEIMSSVIKKKSKGQGIFFKDFFTLASYLNKSNLVYESDDWAR